MKVSFRCGHYPATSREAPGAIQFANLGSNRPRRERLERSNAVRSVLIRLICVIRGLFCRKLSAPDQAIIGLKS